ncbi:hypothetical protein [Zavarzinella formosa]|uniref:hypothetical protein n=1 Tax=Zavarzinella formosa TaxID=360055 RepID=UPI0002D903A1|nr:hypothetical protein [Zavarzinella formosa]
MAAIITLQSVVDEMELLGAGEAHAFLNRHTGELYGGMDEQIDKAIGNDDEKSPEWEREAIRRLREILGSPDWLELPRRGSHEDHRVMEQFCLTHCSGRRQQDLLAAISGRGAFGRFRAAIHQFGIEDAWHGFHLKWLAKEAAMWLEANGIPYKS